MDQLYRAFLISVTPCYAWTPTVQEASKVAFGRVMGKENVQRVKVLQSSSTLPWAVVPAEAPSDLELHVLPAAELW
jgi:hypothetical protein